MNALANVDKQLTLLLQQDIDYASRLSSLLENERIALKEREFKGLADIAQEKQLLVVALQENNEKKLSLLSPFIKHSDGLLLFDVLIKQYGHKTAQSIKALNDELAEKMAHCRHLNTVNGQIIASSLQNNQELLKILTGKTNNDLYNASGKLAMSTTKTKPFQQV